MKKKNLILKRSFSKVNNLYLVNKVIERTISLKSLQLLRQSVFLIDHYLLKNNRFKRKLCLVTSRSRAVNNYTRTTRHILKDYATNGYLYGLTKSTW